MPNHVTSWVEIFTEDKPKMSQLKKKVLKKKKGEAALDHEVDFDFNGIIKMPPSLMIESGSETDLGMAALHFDTFTRYRGYPWFEEKYPGVTSPKQLKAFLEKDNPKALEQGKVAMSNLKKYGYKDWYDWSNANWGTKWNSYECQVLYKDHCTLVVVFQTAWGSPIPIFEKLVEMGFDVNVKWQDEDPSNEGEFGDPYSSFEIYHPQLEVEYIGRHGA